MRNTMATTQRTGTISRRGFALGLGVLLSSVAAPQLSAKKKGKDTIKSVKDRVRAASEFCTDAGGSVTTTVRPGGTTTSCSGGLADGTLCVHSSKRTRCYHALTTPPQSAPAAPPSGGVADEPSGGRNPGGDAAAPPTGGVEDPSSPSSGDPVRD